MAITRPIRSLLARGLAAALALGAAGCSVYPSAPAEPAFDTDVLPIFKAHCTRCHDNNPDGGGTNHEVYRPDAAGGPVTAAGPPSRRVRPLLPVRWRCSPCYGVPGYACLIQTEFTARTTVGCPPRRPGGSTNGR